MNEPPRLWQLGRLTLEMEFRPLICVEAPSAVEAVAKGREEYPGVNGALAVQEVDCDDVAGEWESLIAAAAASLAELRGFEHRNGLVPAVLGEATPSPHHATTANRLRDAGLSDAEVAAELEGRFGPVAPRAPDKPRDRVEVARAAAALGPKPGSTHRHYKGDVYRTIGPAVIEATLEPATLYVGTQSDIPWVRPLSDWMQWVDGRDGAPVPRFEPIPPVRVTPSHANAIGPVGKGITLDPTL